MKSVLSNPIESAINAFGAVSNILNQNEAAGERREEHKQIMDIRKTQADQQQEQFGWARDKHMTEQELGDVMQALIKEGDHTPEEQAAVFKAVTNSSLGEDLGKIDSKVAAIDKISSIVQSNPGMLKQGGLIPLDKLGLKKDWNTIYGHKYNTGGSLYFGETSKEAENLIVDPQTKTIATVLKMSQRMQNPEGNIVAKHVQPDGKSDIFMAPTDATPAGLAPGGQGNIDLTKRPVVLRGDGTISTVLSSSFEVDGKQVVLPLVGEDGRIKTGKEAVDDYLDKKSPDYGKHLGIFNTIADAEHYGQNLHSDPIWKKDLETHHFDPDKMEWSYGAPLTFGRGTDPKDTVVQLPIALVAGQLDQHEKLLRKAQSLMAKLSPEKKLEEIRKQGLNRKQNQAIFQALDEVKADTTLKTVADRREAVVRKIVGKDPDITASTAADLVAKVIPEKSFTSMMGSQVGKRMEDRARLVASSSLGEKDPAVIAFDKESAGAEKKKGSQKTIYGPGGKTKEVWIEDGKDYEPPAGYSLAKPDKPEKDTTEKESDKKQKRIDSNLKSAPGIIKRKLIGNAKAGEGPLTDSRLTASANDFKDDKDADVKATEATKGMQRVYESWTKEYIRGGMDAEAASDEAIKQVVAAKKRGDWGKFFTVPEKKTLPKEPAAGEKYKSAADVKAAFKAGKLKRDEAAVILKDQYGMK